MGTLRTGARTFLNVMGKACRLSHIPGFQTGMVQILGADQANAVLALWNPLCALIDTLIATDNWYNQIDRVNDDGAGEDALPV